MPDETSNCKSEGCNHPLEKTSKLDIFLTKFIRSLGLSQQVYYHENTKGWNVNSKCDYCNCTNAQGE